MVLPVPGFPVSHRWYDCVSESMPPSRRRLSLSMDCLKWRSRALSSSIPTSLPSSASRSKPSSPPMSPLLMSPPLMSPPMLLGPWSPLVRPPSPLPGLLTRPPARPAASAATGAGAAVLPAASTARPRPVHRPLRAHSLVVLFELCRSDSASSVSSRLRRADRSCFGMPGWASMNCTRSEAVARLLSSRFRLRSRSRSRSRCCESLSRPLSSSSELS